MHDPSSSSVARLESDVAITGVVAGDALRAAEVASVVFVGLLTCPPLAILAFCVVAPLLVLALVGGLIAAVLSTPYLLVHHFRDRDAPHASLLEHRLRRAVHAALDLLPHRIVADARRR
jgi:hypothetical protein